MKAIGFRRFDYTTPQDLKTKKTTSAMTINIMKLAHPDLFLFEPKRAITFPFY